MHAIELARRGYRAAGADHQPQDDRNRQRNAQSANVDVTFRTAGFLIYAETFKDIGIFFPSMQSPAFGNSLPHLTTREDILKRAE